MNVSSELAILRWKPASWLRATGPDAGAFLQGQFTNDLRSATSGISVYGLWLNVKGKVVADSFVFRGPADDEYWIGSYSSPALVIRERLESHIIADDVTVEDHTESWEAIAAFGAGAADWIRTLRARGAHPGFTFAGRRAKEEVAEWVYPVDMASEVSAAVGDAPHLTAGEAELRRIDAGIALVPKDVGPSDLPNEAGLDAAAISYQKGCYLGQEVMARLKSMGQVRRRLLRVAGERPPPAPLPVPLFAGGRQVGELRSAAATPAGGFIGLAMVSLLHVTPERELAFAADGEASVRLLDRP